MSFGYAPFPPVTGGHLLRTEMSTEAHPRQFWSQNANAGMSKMSRSKGKGSTSRRRLCQPNVNPSRTIYRGAIEATQKCHRVCAPTSFIWCHELVAEMSASVRTKGRAKIFLQKCHVTNALPNQLQGFNAQSQKCHNAHNPRKGAI